MRLIPLLYLLFFSLSLSGQQSFFKSLEVGEKEGMPTFLVGSGLQCSRGYIWFHGNHSGLCRYDGIRIKTYTQRDNNLGGDFIRSFAESKDSLLWIRIRMETYSIHVFDPITEQATSIQDYLGAELAFDPSTVLMTKNQDGTLWFYNPNEKGSINIYEYDGKKMHLWGAFAARTTRRIHKLSDSLFFHFSTYYNDPELLFMDRKGQIIERQHLPKGATKLEILKNFDTSTPSLLFKYLKSDSVFLAKLSLGNPIEILDKDQNDILYLYNNGYILKRQAYQLSFFDLDMNYLAQCSVRKKIPRSFEDRQGGIWFSDKRATLSRYQFADTTLFERYTCQPFDSTCHPASRGIAQTASGDVFITQFRNLLRKNAHGIRLFHATDILKSIPEELNGVFPQKDSAILWISALDKLLKLNANDPSKDPIAYSYSKKKHRGVTQPYIDKQGSIWVGNAEGLFQLSTKDSILLPYQKYNAYEYLKKGHVFAFHENPAGIWLSTSLGIFLLDYEKGIVAHYHTKGTDKNYLPHNYFYHLYEDADGTFWLASKNGGLIHWNLKTGDYEQFTKNEGLSDNVIYGVYEDDYERLWLPSNYGLMSFDKKTKEVVWYLEEDGIPNVEFNTLSHYQGDDGHLYFGGLTGSMSFHPNALRNRVSNTNLQITGFKKQNYEGDFYVHTPEKLLKNKGFELTPDDKSFELSFALLNFKSTRNNLYAYKIEGYDNNWQKLEQAIIKINTLPYGTYQLRLRAKAPAYSWQEYSFPINIHVLRPFYLQTWFLVLIFLSGIFSIVQFVRWRISALEKQKTALEQMVKERTSEIEAQAEQLKVLDKVKSRFFANVSHELRTPLSLILGPISSLKNKPFEVLSKDNFHHNINLMERNSNKLLDLIDEILDLSKLEAGKLELQEKATHLKKYTHRIFHTFESLSTLKQINYRIDYQADKDLKLLIDPIKIEKILNNFLNNAFKFTPKDGTITLSIKEQATTILIKLEDSGRGIDQKDLPHVFERFYQSKLPHLKAQGGTGIGLALVQELAHLMQAKVWVESQIKKGSCFYFEFPKKVVQTHSKDKIKVTLNDFAHKEEEVITAAWNPSPKSKTILLVEDNIDLRQFIYSILESQYQVILAENGQEGLTILNENNKVIDLIVSDVMMPIMDGFSMLERIKEHPNWRSLPMIMLTARASEEDKLKALTIGVNDYIIKPFSTEELLVRIKNLLQNYEARQLWKQELILTANNIRAQENNSTITKKEPLTLASSSIKDEEVEVSVKDLQWMKEVEDQIRANIQEEDFEMSVLAKKLFISKRQLDRKIVKITGLTPAKLVKEVRLQTARTYLEKGTFDTIAEVSFAVGFKTASHFSKIYQARFGKKPIDFF